MRGERSFLSLALAWVVALLILTCPVWFPALFRVTEAKP